MEDKVELEIMINHNCGMNDETEAALSFKPNKTEGYEKTSKCNAMESNGVDSSFVQCDTEELKGETRCEFDAYIIAEGEWSDSTKKLGFDKLIEKFAPAIGLVINMSYDKSDPLQKKAESIPMGLPPQLAERGIKCENLEYLKTETHYIVTTIKKSSLLSLGILRTNQPTVRELLTS